MRRALVSFAALALALSACGGGTSKPNAEQPAAKTEPVPKVAPLTGEPDPSGASLQRCAITVKIDNTPESQPKHGIEQADVVYEEVVEGGLTRLAAVFNSKAPDRVASVRSVRKTDQSLVTPLRGVFVYSGGAPYAIESIDTAPVVQLDETRAGDMMFRDDRDAPYDLNARVDRMYSRCKDPAPAPLFTYRAADATVLGEAVASVQVGFLAGYAVTWRWDAASVTWEREIFGRPETTASGAAIGVANVVVMFADYVGGNVDGVGAEAVLTGTGKLRVFTGGKVVDGTWSRPDRATAARLLDAAGQEIRLAPGRTWVEIPEPGYAVTVTAPPAPATTAPASSAAQ
jgi:hypothetical protein